MNFCYYFPNNLFFSSNYLYFRYKSGPASLSMYASTLTDQAAKESSDSDNGTNFTTRAKNVPGLRE